MWKLICRLSSKKNSVRRRNHLSWNCFSHCIPNSRYPLKRNRYIHLIACVRLIAERDCRGRSCLLILSLKKKFQLCHVQFVLASLLFKPVYISWGLDWILIFSEIAHSYCACDIIQHTAHLDAISEAILFPPAPWRSGLVFICGWNVKLTQCAHFASHPFKLVDPLFFFCFFLKKHWHNFQLPSYLQSRKKHPNKQSKVRQLCCETENVSQLTFELLQQRSQSSLLPFPAEFFSWQNN